MKNCDKTDRRGRCSQDVRRARNLPGRRQGVRLVGTDKWAEASEARDRLNVFGKTKIGVAWPLRFGFLKARRTITGTAAELRIISAHLVTGLNTLSTSMI